jgi:hypothetical protein
LSILFGDPGRNIKASAELNSVQQNRGFGIDAALRLFREYVRIQVPIENHKKMMEFLLISKLLPGVEGGLNFSHFHKWWKPMSKVDTHFEAKRNPVNHHFSIDRIYMRSRLSDAGNELN